MTRRKTIVSLLLLCAFVVAAFAAQSASAEEATTLFTCTPVETGAKFSDEHCTQEGSGSGFRHTEIAAGSMKEVTGSNEKTTSETKAAQAATLHLAISTIPITITCKKASSSGSLMNVAGPPMRASGSITTAYTECETILEGTKKNCKVKEPMIWNSNLSTVVEGSEMYVKATGSGAGELAFSVTFENNGAEVCPKGLTALNPYKITGAAIGTPNGATLEFKEKEPHNTLKVGGNVVELTQIETLRLKGGNPIIPTTTET
jgi:hypothetical protein